MNTQNRVTIDLTEIMPGYVWVIILIAGLAVFLTVLYFLICGLTALRGWQSYGSRFRGPEEFPTGVKVFSGESMMIGGNVAPANYRHVITAGYDDQGIYLRMGAFFRAFHPPLFIPWEAVTAVEQEKAVKGVYTAVQCAGMPRLVFFRKFGDVIHAKWQSTRSKGNSAQ